MKPWIMDILLIYCAFNLAAGMVATMNVVPGVAYPAFQDWTSISGMFTGGWQSILGKWTSLQGIGTIVSGLFALVGLATGNYMIMFGFLSLMALSFFAPIIISLFTGFPAMLVWFGVPMVIVDALIVLGGFVVFLFLFEFIGQRDWS